MITALPVVKVRDLRKGDTLTGTDGNLPSGAYVSHRLIERGADKGKRKVTIEGKGKEFVVDGDAPVKVVREVPTAEERDAYKVAMRKFYAVKETVEARRKVLDAAAQVQANMQRIIDRPYPERHYSVLGQAGPEVERYSAVWATLADVHAPVIADLGFTIEHIDAWARAGHWGEEPTEVNGVEIPNLWSLHPDKPRNADCYLDGTKAVHPRADEGYSYDVAPVAPEVTA